MKAKSTFIISELWVLSVAGAFQRAGLYAPKATDKAKKAFKKDLKNKLEQLVEAQYFNPVNEQTHIANICALAEYSKAFAPILKNGAINFGVSQKILNLFLKYMWCLQLIPTPPHFPVDRMIQLELNNLAIKNGLAKREVKPWTHFTNQNEYLEIIRFAELIKKKDKNYTGISLAEMELAIFNRR